MPEQLPILALREDFFFPGVMASLQVGRPRSVAAIHTALERYGGLMLLLTQRYAESEDPLEDDLFPCGVVCKVLNWEFDSDAAAGTPGIVSIECMGQARLEALESQADHLIGRIGYPERVALDESRNNEYLAKLKKLFQKLARDDEGEAFWQENNALKSIDDAVHCAHRIASHLTISLEMKHELLEEVDEGIRIERVLALLRGQKKLDKLSQRLDSKMRKEIEDSQRINYLNEKIRVMQQELDQLNGNPDGESELERRVREAELPDPVRQKVDEEHRRFKLMHPMSGEYSVSRNYLECVLGMPWTERSKLKRSISRAAQVLDADHYGLEEVKERILDYLAVQQRVRHLRGPVMCLVGPPGVGKTSLAESIARATGRKYVRIALGGIVDESEIRGHRRTYIGSMPGKLMQRMARAGTRNPLFLLDEVDKIGKSANHGDPAAALLEVLDPEQNHCFGDHYLEIDFDLSEVMFLCTANTTNIPEPLLDRMEVIKLPGYLEDEKFNIGRSYLLPRQMERNGVREGELELSDEALLGILRGYTHEPGVRELDRQLAKLCRKVVRRHTMLESEADAEKKTKRQSGAALQGGAATQKTRSRRKPKLSARIAPEDLKEYLGSVRYSEKKTNKADRVGRVKGLAWTASGYGVVFDIEVEIFPGKGGRVEATGQFGPSMKDAVKVAEVFLHTRAERLGISQDFFAKHEIHVTVSEFETPVDGPSANIALVLALISAVTGIPVRGDVAMTGASNFSGDLRKIGGVREKLLAAVQGEVPVVIIPEENEPDLDEVPDAIKDKLDIRIRSSLEQVFEDVLVRSPWVGRNRSKGSDERPDKTRKRTSGKSLEHQEPSRLDAQT